MSEISERADELIFELELATELNHNGAMGQQRISARRELRDYIVNLEAEVAELRDGYDPKVILPIVVNGIPSKPVWVCAHEFGQPYAFAVVTCWLSSDRDAEPKWYLDRDFYNIDAMCEIAQQVTRWWKLPEVQK